MNAPHESFADLLRKYREAHNWSQQTLGGFMRSRSGRGVQQPTVQKYEDGTVIPPRHRVLNLQMYLKDDEYLSLINQYDDENDTAPDLRAVADRTARIARDTDLDDLYSSIPENAEAPNTAKTIRRASQKYRSTDAAATAAGMHPISFMVLYDGGRIPDDEDIARLKAAFKDVPWFATTIDAEARRDRDYLSAITEAEELRKRLASSPREAALLEEIARRAYDWPDATVEEALEMIRDAVTDVRAHWDRARRRSGRHPRSDTGGAGRA